MCNKIVDMSIVNEHLDNNCEPLADTGTGNQTSLKNTSLNKAPPKKLTISAKVINVFFFFFFEKWSNSQYIYIRTISLLLNQQRTRSQMILNKHQQVPRKSLIHKSKREISHHQVFHQVIVDLANRSKQVVQKLMSHHWLQEVDYHFNKKVFKFLLTIFLSL
jgi:hypothetical protein